MNHHRPGMQGIRVRRLQILDMTGEAFEVVDDGGHRLSYIPMRTFCSLLGLQWWRQHQRILREAILCEAAGYVRPNHAEEPGAVLCLPLPLIPLWLCTLNTMDVRPDAMRHKIIDCQR